MAVMASRNRSAISGDVTKFMGKLKRTKAPVPGRLENTSFCGGDLRRRALNVLSHPVHSTRGRYNGMWKLKRTLMSSGDLASRCIYGHIVKRLTCKNKDYESYDRAPFSDLAGTDVDGFAVGAGCSRREKIHGHSHKESQVKCNSVCPSLLSKSLC